MGLLETIAVAALEKKGLRPDGVPTSCFALVVDDEPGIADTMAAILRTEGYSALAAYDAETALEIARVAPPELVLTDISMPGMSGVEMAVQLKELIPECAVVLFSALLITDEVLECAVKAGHQFTVLTKPIAIPILLDELKKLSTQPA